jgi:hypothetical protein
MPILLTAPRHRIRLLRRVNAVRERRTITDSPGVGCTTILTTVKVHMGKDEACLTRATIIRS